MQAEVEMLGKEMILALPKMRLHGSGEHKPARLVCVKPLASQM